MFSSDCTSINAMSSVNVGSSPRVFFGTHNVVASSYSICHVSVVGRPLWDFKAHLPAGDQSTTFWLECIGTDKGANETGGDGANELVAST